MTLNGVRNGNQIAITNSSTNSRTSLIGSGRSNKPIGTRIFGSCFHFNSIQSKRTFHKTLVLILTFIAYTCFHLGRRPLSVVKNVLNQNCSALPNSSETQSQSFSLDNQNISSTSPTFNENSDDNSCSWAPFDDNTTANQLLAILDTSFLLSYAIFMFFSGVVAERMDLRYFISLGSAFSGLGLIAFGLAYSLNIHSLTYFIVVQVLSGMAQATGWPVCVTCVSNWFEPNKRGLIYGLWNSHTNVGNIWGATIAGYFVEKDWGLSFMVPGAIMIIVGVLLFLFLVPTPQDVDLAGKRIAESPIKPSSSSASVASDYGQIEDAKVAVEVSRPRDDSKAVSFLTALKIPGVLEYSMCLFFSKLVSYTFLYWLPRYITSSTSNSSENSAYLSTPFDIGGIFGAIAAGYLSDKYKASALTCNAMLLLAVPSLVVYQKFGALSTMNNILLQLLVGSLVNGPYCLITTAVSADLGHRITDGRAMATVAAIIDGMGSVGAVVGPLFAGFVSNTGDWQAVFLMLILADLLASLCLVRVTIAEIKQKLSKSGRVILNGTTR